MPIKYTISKNEYNKPNAKSSRRGGSLLQNKKKTRVSPFMERNEKESTSTRGKLAMRHGKKKHLANKEINKNIPGTEVVAVEVPLMTQEELHHAKKKCLSTARRLHRIKRRLLLDIAEGQEANENASASTSRRSCRRDRMARTASFTPHHQGSDSMLSTFFESTSSGTDLSVVNELGPDNKSTD